MAEHAVATVTVQDEAGQHATMSVDFGYAVFGNWTDKSDTLAEIIDSYSRGREIRRADILSHEQGVPADFDWTTEQYRLCDQKAVLLFKIQGLISLRDIRMELPCPREDMFELIPGKGFRVKKNVGDDIAQQISDATSAIWDQGVTFKEGWLKGKR